MAGRKDEAQEIVADVIVDGEIEIRLGPLLLDVELVADLDMLALQHDISPQPVNGTMFSGGHEPGARVVRDTGLRPPLQCNRQRVLRKILSLVDIAHNPRKTGDESGRFDAPDGVNGAVSVGYFHSRQPIFY